MAKNFDLNVQLDTVYTHAGFNCLPVDPFHFPAPYAPWGQPLTTYKEQMQQLRIYIPYTGQGITFGLAYIYYSASRPLSQIST